MNPEELQEILAAARRAEARGVPRAEIDAYLQEHTGLPNLPALATAASGGQPFQPSEAAEPTEEEAAAQRLSEGGGNALTDFLRMAGQGATFGFADEIAGLAAGLGAVVPGGRSPGEARRDVTAASRQRVEDLRTLAPGASLASELAGGIAVPGLGAGASAGRGQSAARAFAGARKLDDLAQGARESARIRAATEGTLQVGRESLRSMGAQVGRGGLLGAAAGGAVSAGEAEGGLSERASAAGQGAVTGGAFGAGLGLLAGALPAGAQFLRNRRIRQETRNPRVAGQMEAVAEDAMGFTRPSQVLDRMADNKKVVQQEFKRMEAEGGFSNHALRTVLNQPIIREQDLGQALRRRGRGNVLDRALSDNATIEYRDVQDIRGSLQDKIDSAFRNGENNLALDLAAQKRKLDDAVSSMFDDQGARRAWRELSMVPDALEAGRRAANMSRDELQQTMQQFAGYPEANIGFRVGIARRILDDTTKKGGKVVKPTVDLMDKLKLALGSEEAANQVVGIMRREGISQAMESVQDAVVKTIGFLGGGSSLVGLGVLSVGG